MKLKLTYELVHGTDRGGEDVSLGVELTAEELPSDDWGEVAEAAGGAFDAWLEEHEDDDLEDPDSEVCVEDGRVRTCESEYGFSVDRPLAEVRKDVVKAAVAGLRPPLKDEWRHAEWCYKVGSKVYVLETELYRDGNAD